jgi:2-phosphoglycerate kinase
MIYLVGGAPRVGKTTLVNHLVQRQPMHAVSTDAIRYMLRRSVPKAALDPDIFIHFSTDIMNLWDKGVDETLEEQNRQSRALWPAMREFIHSYDTDGIDLVVEGVAVLPEFASSLDVEHRSVFIGNRSKEHMQCIKDQAHANEHDWIRHLPDEKFERATEFFRAMSDYFATQCAKYNLPYVEIADDTFDRDLQQAAEQLLN